jgi:sugar lactone lactonase YvrE
MKRNPFPLLFAALSLTSASAQPTVDFLITNRVTEPHSIAIDPSNKFYLTDSADHRVFKYDPDNGALTGVAGVGGQAGADNGPGFVARFFSPKGIVLARGGLVVADSGNHTLRFLTLTGAISVVSTFAGAVGEPGLVDGPLTTARFNSPVGLAVDAAGNIYVADSKNNAVRKIDLNNVVSTVSTAFSQPSALAIGSNGELYVADTRNHAIKVIAPNGTTTLLAGSNSPTITGTNDSFFAEEALFNSPGGLLWLGGTTGLLVSDTGNHTLRRVFFDPIVASFFPTKNGYSVETYAGIPGRPGFTDGILPAAQFNSPTGLARDQDNGLLIADLGNHAVRRIQTTPRLPRVGNPKIGNVIFVVDEKTGALVSQLVPFSEATFNNDVIIAIMAESRTETFYTIGPTPGLFQPDTIPTPDTLNSQPAPPYADGLPPDQVKPSILEARPDVTVKAISNAEGRRPSELVQARIQFKVAPPIILGDNPALFVLTNETVGADMWYTLDGSVPTNQPPSIQASSDTISLRITNAVTFRARAFKRNYKPSEITTKTFFPTDFQANRISFGFERGEASSQFLGSAGQTFIAPVTLSLLPNQKIYTLQFNLTVTNQGAAVAVAPGGFGFQSMLSEPLPEANTFRRIDPKMFIRYRIELFTNNVPQGILVTTNFIPEFQDLVAVNSTQNLLAVGWFEVIGKTNLYNTIGQDLVSFSHAHDKLFLSSSGKTVLGGYSFQIPATAPNGSAYRIRLGRPSAVENSASKDVFIDVPTDGSLGPGAINASKDVTVVAGGLSEGQLRYIVGDVTPFRWYNAGDFGDTNILNNDVFQVFRAATYGFNIPPPGTDFFDAMDSCCNNASGLVTTNIYSGSETNINGITLGNGILDVADVFVTFRRSLDPSLKWFARYWVNGQRQAAEVQNLFRGALASSVSTPQVNLANVEADVLTTGPSENPSVTFQVDDLGTTPGQLVNVPVRAEIFGKYPLRVLMLSLSVEALDGAPPVTGPVQFIPALQLGKPTMTTSAGSGNYAAAWLEHRIAGLAGSATVGTLRFTIPANARSASAYRIHFEHASGSPNGFSAFPRQTIDGLLGGGDHSASSFNDGIPDSWRLRHFGSLANYLSQAAADADGDGVPNSAEFKAGTNPNDIRSQLRMLAEKRQHEDGTASKGLTLRWPSTRGKTYVVEVAPGISSATWLPITSQVTGTGGEMEFTIANPVDIAQFYRVRLVE